MLAKAEHEQKKLRLCSQLRTPWYQAECSVGVLSSLRFVQGQQHVKERFQTYSPYLWPFPYFDSLRASWESLYGADNYFLWNYAEFPRSTLYLIVQAVSNDIVQRWSRKVLPWKTFCDSLPVWVENDAEEPWAVFCREMWKLNKSFWAFQGCLDIGIRLANFSVFWFFASLEQNLLDVCSHCCA